MKNNETILMKLIDDINGRFGYGKLRLSSDCNKNFFSKENNRKDQNSAWQMKSNYRSPCYTTSWCDIPIFKV